MRTGLWEGQKDPDAGLEYHCQGQRYSRLNYKLSTLGFPSMTVFFVFFFNGLLGAGNGDTQLQTQHSGNQDKGIEFEVWTVQ